MFKMFSIEDGDLRLGKHAYQHTRIVIQQMLSNATSQLDGRTTVESVVRFSVGSRGHSLLTNI